MHRRALSSVHFLHCARVCLFVYFRNCAYLISKLLFFNTFQKVVNRAGWLDDCHGPSPILCDTAIPLCSHWLAVMPVIPCQVIQQNWDFSSNAHQNSRNFVRRMILSFWAQQSKNFLIQICISEIMSIWNFDVFQENWTKKFLEFCCWNLNWLSLLYLWIFSFNIFQ